MRCSLLSFLLGVTALHAAAESIVVGKYPAKIVPQQISEIAYCRHASQYYGGVKFTLGSYYDYYGYTLIASTVGPDVIGGDFFENIR